MNGKTPKALVTDHGYASVDTEKNILRAAGYSLDVMDGPPSDEKRAAIKATGREYGAILVQYTVFDAELLSALAPGTTLIRYGMGYDNIDVQAAKGLGLRVCNLPTYGVTAVAEYAATAILLCLRRLKSLDAGFRANGWQQKEVPYGRESASATVGLIGFSHIGHAVYDLLSGFGFAFSIYDPYRNDVPAAAKAASLDELLGVADIVSLHAQLTDETRHMIDAAAFAKMKVGASLVNTARGAIVDTAALLGALATGKIAYAVLDVFEDEPLAPTSPLFGHPNVLLTPHVSWKTTEAEERIHVMAGEEAVLALSGRPLRFSVA